MDSEKLIEQLNDWNEKYISSLCGERKLKCDEYCIQDDCLMVKAATALSTLQAENDRLKRERDAAEEDLNAIIGDIEEIRRGYGVDNYDADSAFADLCENYCANKSHRCYVEAEKYRCNNFKWCGPKEE